MFGVGTDKGVLKLFDVRSYAQGPFDAFTVSLLTPPDVAVCKGLLQTVVELRVLSFIP